MSRHGFFLTPRNEMWGYGENSSGQLSLGHQSNVSKPEKLSFFRNPNHIEMIAVGSSYSVFVIGDDLYVAGNSFVKKVFDEIEREANVGLATKLNVPYSAGFTHCASGYDHVLLVTKKGSLLVGGDNGNGQLGQGHRNTVTGIVQIKKVRYNSDSSGKDVGSVIYASGGGSFSFFLTKQNQLFACGSNMYGVLGIFEGFLRDIRQKREIHPHVTVPTLVSFFSTKKVLKVAGGFRHACFLVKEPQGLRVYSCGSNEDGQTGNRTINNDTDQHPSIKAGPQRVSLPHDSDRPIDILCGYHHTIVVGKERIYGVGFNSNREFGKGSNKKLDPVRRGSYNQYFHLESIGYPKGCGILRKDVVQVEVGGNETLLFTKRGELFGTGFSASQCWPNVERPSHQPGVVTTFGECVYEDLKFMREGVEGNRAERFSFLNGLFGKRFILMFLLK